MPEVKTKEEADNLSEKLIETRRTLLTNEKTESPKEDKKEVAVHNKIEREYLSLGLGQVGLGILILAVSQTFVLLGIALCSTGTITFSYGIFMHK